jgi:PAS domain S-box-containing protein
MCAARTTRLYLDRLILGALALAGTALSVWLWRIASGAEEARADLALSRQVEARHALVRQTLAGYEECLLAMRVFMVHGREINQDKFGAVARTLFVRYPGFLGLQWAPKVAAEERAEWERAHGAVLGPLGRIRERSRAGSDIVALPRREYFPMLLAEPLAANRHVLGSDAGASPLRPVFGAIGPGDALAMSGVLKLVYESGANNGIVMVCPVPAAERAGGADTVTGFLLGVFRVEDLLAQPLGRPQGSTLEVMFLDESATRPDRRVLYVHRDRPAPGPLPAEVDFVRGPHQTSTLKVAGRTWRMLYRDPEAGRLPLLGSPLLALLAGLSVTGLGAGLLALLQRRTAIIQREVRERTAELSESRRQLRSLMDALPGMAYRGTYDDCMNLTFISEGVLGLTGFPAADFLEGRLHLRDLVHPDDLARVRAQTRAALDEKQPFEVEYRLRAKDGTEKWVLSRGRGVFGLTAAPVFEGLAIDITAQKNAEAARLGLERKLLEGQKLESLGLLAGGIAHDFNNLLSTVIGNAEMSRLGLPPGHAVEGKLRAIGMAASRAAELCRQMLAYAGRGKLVVEPVDLSALVEEMVPLLKVSNARLGRLRLELTPGLPVVNVDATQIRQIVMNLVLNAADAIPDHGGEIVLTTGVARLEPDMVARCIVGTDMLPGACVFLEVRDNGVGMTPEVRARVFDPFFTTKPTGRGLGLSAVLGIVRGHGGALCVQSAPGQGSTFRLFLSPAEGPAEEFTPLAAPAEGWRREGRVLVVDDQDEVRWVMCEMLRSFGLEPVEASDGPAAIVTFKAQPNGFDLVVLDLLMPDFGGEETLAGLRAVNPAVRVLLMSGYCEDDVLGRNASGAPLGFLGKPFTRANLERELRALLEAGAPGA